MVSRHSTAVQNVLQSSFVRLEIVIEGRPAPDDETAVTCTRYWLYFSRSVHGKKLSWIILVKAFMNDDHIYLQSLVIVGLLTHYKPVSVQSHWWLVLYNKWSHHCAEKEVEARRNSEVEESTSTVMLVGAPEGTVIRKHTYSGSYEDISIPVYNSLEQFLSNCSMHSVN